MYVTHHINERDVNKQPPSDGKYPMGRFKIAPNDNPNNPPREGGQRGQKVQDESLFQGEAWRYQHCEITWKNEIYEQIVLLILGWNYAAE